MFWHYVTLALLTRILQLHRDFFLCVCQWGKQWCRVELKQTQKNGKEATHVNCRVVFYCVYCTLFIWDTGDRNLCIPFK
jgi:hypothetical protein